MAEARVVIVGGGFGGLVAAKALAHAPVRVTVVDRTNHHLFQPLLYQVASAGLSPADIASPIRSILSRQKNVEVLMARATGIDLANKCVTLEDGAIPLRLSDPRRRSAHQLLRPPRVGGARAGAGESLDAAIVVRRRMLLAFEHAETSTDDAERPARSSRSWPSAVAPRGSSWREPSPS